MQNEKTYETESSSAWFDATMEKQKPSQLNGVVFVFLLIPPILATIAYGGVDSWSLGIISVLFGIIALLYFVDAILSKRLVFDTNPLQFPVLALILIGIIQLIPIFPSAVPADLLSVPTSGTLSIDPNATRLAVVQLVIYLFFFAAALALINSQSRLRATIYTMIVFASAMAFFGIIQHLTGTDTIYGIRLSSHTSPFASYANKHHFAALMEMLIGIPLSMLYGSATKKDKRALLIICIILMGMAILLTSSRGGMISLLAVIGFVTLFNLTNKKNDDDFLDVDEQRAASGRRKFMLIGASLTVVLVLFGAVLFLGGSSELLRGTGLAAPTDVTTGRSHFWWVALQIIRDNPLIGTGLDTFGMAFTKFDTWNGTLRVEQAHNDYLQILTDAGILGFACVAAFIYLLFTRSFKLISQTSDKFRSGVALGALAGCFGVLIHSLFDFPLRTPANPYFFLLLVVIATGTVNYPKLYRKRA